MTPEQYATFKTAILADPTLAQYVSGAGTNYQAIADAFNATAAGPNNIAWKPLVGITDTGKQFVGTEWAGMTSANHTRLQTVAQWLAGGYSPALADVRAMFDDIWSGAGGAQTRARLLAFWKRTMLRIEKTLSTGTGSDASPAVMGYEGTVTTTDVNIALNG